MFSKINKFDIMLAFLFILCMNLASTTQVSVTKLNSDWQVEILEAGAQGSLLKNQKMSTNLPTTIHLDLLKHKKIQDPFYRDNYPKLRWVSSSKVKYSKNFSVDAQNTNRAIQLIFHGIDTYSSVKLNGEQILKTNNSFVAYTARVQKLIKAQNLLQVIIESTQSHDNLGQSKNNMPFKYAHTRKACYQYSWDWAPELVTLGIWRDVQLRIFDEVRIDYVWIRNKQISQDKAVLNFATKLQFNTYKQQKISSGYKIKIHSKNTHDPNYLVQSVVSQQTNYVDFVVSNPKFWWPNGIGQPNIYQFVVYLINDQRQIDKKTIIFGIRTVQLDLQNRQFKVMINGYPVYCKGANYVPLDMFHPRIYNKQFQTEKTYTIQKLFDDAVQSNFNMIRLWGGGQYETDQFLELASRKGIMIFYDFMFSDSIYPSHHDFLVNVQQEIKHQIRRTRNYPALALWCGNNQILQGVQDWGWGSAAYMQDYKKLFEGLIKKVVQIENPDISYIPSSPVYGVGNYGFERGGDFHYWGVWAGGAGFQSYQTAVGPFNSEFGTQALPVWHTIKEFTQQKDRRYDSSVLLTHERHNSQFNTLRSYMERYAKKSKDFQNQVYLSSIVQAFAIQLAIRAQRTSKPKSYGTLYWQFNDAWPAISWAAIDYYGRWKALQYMAKRSYQNLAVFAMKNGSVIAINDLLRPAEVLVKVAVIQFDGKIVTQFQKSLTLQADSTNKVFVIEQKYYANDQRKVVAYCQIQEKGQLKMWNTFYFANYKQLELPKATVRVEYNFDKNQISFKSDKLVKNLFIDHKQKYIQLTDNYFDLVPGYPRKVKLLLNQNLKQLKGGLRYTSVRQASQQEELQVIIN